MVPDGWALGSLVPLPAGEVEDHGDTILRFLLERMLSRDDVVRVAVESENAGANLAYTEASIKVAHKRASS